MVGWMQQLACRNAEMLAVSVRARGRRGRTELSNLRLTKVPDDGQSTLHIALLLSGLKTQHKTPQEDTDRAMPTLVWVRRPKSSTDTAAGGDSASNGRREKTVPESVASAVVAAAADDAAVSAPSKQHVAGRKKKKRKMNSSKKATAAKKRSKATPERDLPTAVSKTPSGKFQSMISWRGKRRYIGTFDTPEQASAAYFSAMKDRDEVKRSALGADEANALFDAAKKKALESFSASAPKKRDLQGVRKLPSGKFFAVIRLGGKYRRIGKFGTPEEASAAYKSVRKDLVDFQPLSFGTDEVDAVFDAAKKRALKTFGGSETFRSEIKWGGRVHYIGNFDTLKQASAASLSVKKDLEDANLSALKKKSKAASERDLPKGVTKRPSGNFASSIWWGGMPHYIGTFDTPEQASAACLSVKKDLDDAELSAGSADEVNVMSIAAQKKAVKAFGGCIPKKKREKTTSERELPRGVSKLPSGKFQCVTFWGGKSRQIGTFESPEQASVAYVSVRKDIDDAKLSAVGADEVDAILQLRKKPPRKHLHRTKK